MGPIITRIMDSDSSFDNPLSHIRKNWNKSLARKNQGKPVKTRKIVRILEKIQENWKILKPGLGGSKIVLRPENIF